MESIVPMAGFLTHWGPPLIWAALIFLLSSSSLDQLPSVHNSQADKAAHAIFFGILSVLLFRLFHRWSALSWGRAAILAIVVTSLYGVSDEFHQSFVPERSPELADWVADTIGAFVGLTIVAIFCRNREPRPERT